MSETLMTPETTHDEPGTDTEAPAVEAPAVETKTEKTESSSQEILEGLRSTLVEFLANQELQLAELRKENEDLKATVNQLMEIVTTPATAAAPAETAPIPKPAAPTAPVETTPPASTETSPGDTISTPEVSSSDFEKPVRENFRGDKLGFEKALGAYHVERGRRANELKTARKDAKKEKIAARKARRGLWIPELIGRLGTARRSAGRVAIKGVKGGAKGIGNVWDASRDYLGV